MKKTKGNKKKRQTCIPYKNVEKELHNVLRYDIKLKIHIKARWIFFNLKEEKRYKIFIYI